MEWDICEKNDWVLVGIHLKEKENHVRGWWNTFSKHYWKNTYFNWNGETIFILFDMYS